MPVVPVLALVPVFAVVPVVVPADFVDGLVDVPVVLPFVAVLPAVPYPAPPVVVLVDGLVAPAAGVVVVPPALPP